MDEDRFAKAQKRLRAAYSIEKKQALSRKIVLITNNDIFPELNHKTKKLIQLVEEYFIRCILEEDYDKYLHCILKRDMTTLKHISIKYKIDLGRLNGYSGYICDTEDEYLDNSIKRINKMIYKV